MQQLPIGAIGPRWPGAMIIRTFVPCRPGYQLAKTAMNLGIEQLSDIILMPAFVMRQGVKLLFQ